MNKTDINKKLLNIYYDLEKISERFEGKTEIKEAIEGICCDLSLVRTEYLPDADVLPDIGTMREKFNNAFNEMMSHLRDSPNWGKDCPCNNRGEDDVIVVDDRDDGYISRYCILCGGRVEKV